MSAMKPRDEAIIALNDRTRPVEPEHVAALRRAIHDQELAPVALHDVRTALVRCLERLEELIPAKLGRVGVMEQISVERATFHVTDMELAAFTRLLDAISNAYPDCGWHADGDNITIKHKET